MSITLILSYRLQHSNLLRLWVFSVRGLSPFRSPQHPVTKQFDSYCEVFHRVSHQRSSRQLILLIDTGPVAYPEYLHRLYYAVNHL
jgi:hypothetical protein